jgi:hypothetical protein
MVVPTNQNMGFFGFLCFVWFAFLEVSGVKIGDTIFNISLVTWLGASDWLFPYTAPHP